MEEKLTKAFGDLQRYELYLLLRGWGAALIAVGIGYPLTSFWFLLYACWCWLDWLGPIIGGLTDEQETALFQLLFFGVSAIIFAVVAMIVSAILIVTYLSVKKTRTKNRKLVTGHMRRFGVSLVILVAFTFCKPALARLDWWLSVGPLSYVWLMSGLFIYLGILPNLLSYLPETAAVFSAYGLLRAETKDHDFAEIRDLGLLLLALCIIEFTWHVVFIVALSPLAIVYPLEYSMVLMIVDSISSIFLEFVLLVLYVVGGLKSWRRGDHVLKRFPGN